MRYELFSEMIEANGNTVRENNMTITHKIPIGALVHVRWSEWSGNGASMRIEGRLWVVQHHRDCDGTPLYAVSPRKPDEMLDDWLGKIPEIFRASINEIYHGFSEGSLTPVEVTPALLRGEDALEWPER